jgi:hypothetical protein
MVLEAGDSTARGCVPGTVNFIDNPGGASDGFTSGEPPRRSVAVEGYPAPRTASVSRILPASAALNRGIEPERVPERQHGVVPAPRRWYVMPRSYWIEALLPAGFGAFRSTGSASPYAPRA